MGERVENARALYLEAIRDGAYEQAIETYAGDRYTQHSTPVPDGKEGFKEFFADFVERNPVRDIEIVRSFEDGRYVFLHVVQDLNHGAFRYVTADIFDTDDDARMIEHWDVVAEMSADPVGGRTEVDGPTEGGDPGHTEATKALVAGFHDEVLASGAHERMAAFVAEDVVQHRPDVGDGVDAWRTWATDVGLRCVERHLVVGSGAFAAVLSEAVHDGTAMAVVDLYRVVDGRIVEHWDVAEEIPPPDTWVNTGKF